jgi:hypothetical protein
VTVAAVVGAVAAGCSIDRIEWETSGFPVEEVAHFLHEEEHVDDPAVRCIKREVGGSLYECRADTAAAAFKCHVKVGIREQIRAIECEREEERDA